MLSSRKTVDFLQNPIGNAIRRSMLIIRDEADQARVAKEFQRGALRVSDAIRKEHDDIARIQNIAALVVGHLFKHPQGKAGQLNLLAAAAMKKQWLLLASIGNAQPALAAVPGGKAESHEPAFDQALAREIH